MQLAAAGQCSCPEQVAAAGTELVISWQWQPPFRLQGADFAFPSWLKSMVDIYQLDISNTSISDRLPDWFCTLQCLCEGLVSEHLQLTGPVPRMPISLSVLDLSRNLLSGPLQ